MLNRRNMLAGLGIGLAAPAIIRTPSLLMPVRMPVQRVSQPSPMMWPTRADRLDFEHFPSGAFAPTAPARGATYFNTYMMEQRVFDGAQWLTLA